MANLESFRANAIDAVSAYVAISGVRKHATVYTEDRANLTEALGLRVGAIDEVLTRRGPGTVLDGPSPQKESLVLA